MALLTETEVRARAARTTTLRKSTALESLTETAAADAIFDVFLSHSSNEPEDILLGIKGFLEDAGLSVYVDKYTDPQLSPDEVTPETAEVLRGRLRASRTLLYVYSRHSKLSRWMPWELGFMDGAGGRIRVAPVMQTAQNAFEGEQYLGLYPYLDRATISGRSTSALWINRGSQEYARYSEWVYGKENIVKRAS
ncbi:toll/interleukin-1 receptor domain-containing protein [uncultured Sphingomonas sp.]|uniref:toll/interleukin-1 receptor domain-containing protein n=1 Tax=uncultured Sphingomonas sp. TaxID=158754 RepID=UPI0035C9D0FA